MPYARVEVTRPKDVNKDLSEYELPNEIWSNVQNANFRKFRSNRAQGVSKVFTSDPTIHPLFHIGATRLGVDEWLYADEVSIWKTEGTAHTELTRGISTAKVPYTGTFENGWTGTVFNGVTLLNNGVDAPQFILQAGTEMADLTDWPASATCKVLRSYKNYMIAMNYYDGTDTNDSMVKWSDSIDDFDSIDNGGGNTWDATAATTLAGENLLGDTPGFIVDGKALGDSFIIYKSDSVYSMDFIGGQFVFSFRQIFNDNSGLLAPGCVASFEGKHLVVGVGTVYIHDGTSKKALSTNRISRELFDQIDETYSQRTRVATDHSNKEVWISFVSTGSTTGLADKAAIYNWEDDTWTFRDLFDISHIAEGVINTQLSNSWNDQTLNWNENTSPWSTSRSNPTKKKLILADYVSDKFMENDVGTTFDGTTFTSTFERTGIDFNDDEGVKYINSVTPHIVGAGTVNISIATQQSPGSPIVFSSPQPFVVDQDYKVNFRESGRYIGIKFESTDDNAWSLTGYTLEFAPVGDQ
jgi:hypothetical protein